MITHRVLSTVLLGVNEQINCDDCISVFGSAGSFSAGIHGRKTITPNLSLLAGIAYTQYGEGGYNVTSAPIGAFALRYDFVDWGSSRPFFDVGTILSPSEKVRYTRSYTTSLGPVSVDRPDLERELRRVRPGGLDRPAVGARRSRRLRRVLAAVAAGQGLHGSLVAFNPFDAAFADRTDRTRLVKIGGQWTHLFGWDIEANINGGYVYALAPRSGMVATVTGEGTVVPTIGNQGWFEYGGRLGYRITKGWIADLFLNGTAGPQPVGTTLTAASACGSDIEPAGSSVPDRYSPLQAGRPVRRGRSIHNHLLPGKVSWIARYRLRRSFSEGGKPGDDAWVRSSRRTTCPHRPLQVFDVELDHLIIACMARCAPAVSEPPRYFISASARSATTRRSDPSASRIAPRCRHSPGARPQAVDLGLVGAADLERDGVGIFHAHAAVQRHEMLAGDR